MRVVLAAFGDSPLPAELIGFLGGGSTGDAAEGCAAEAEVEEGGKQEARAERPARLSTAFGVPASARYSVEESIDEGSEGGTRY